MSEQNDTNHKSGRPTKITQLHIQKILRPYFERGISASVTAEEKGMNIKTVCKYFDEWSEIISESETSNFLERHKKERERIVITYDKQILGAWKIYDYIDGDIEECKKEKKSKIKADQCKNS